MPIHNSNFSRRTRNFRCPALHFLPFPDKSIFVKEISDTGPRKKKGRASKVSFSSKKVRGMKWCLFCMKVKNAPKQWYGSPSAGAKLQRKKEQGILSIFLVSKRERNFRCPCLWFFCRNFAPTNGLQYQCLGAFLTFMQNGHHFIPLTFWDKKET